MTDEDVLKYFETCDLTEALVTHAQASGILRMRQRDEQSGKRKRRSDAGETRKRKTDEAPLLNYEGEQIGTKALLK